MILLDDRHLLGLLLLDEPHADVTIDLPERLTFRHAPV